MEYTTMLVSGREAGCANCLISTDPKAIVAFLKRNRTLMGFSVQYAFHRTKRIVVEIHKKGKLVQRDIQTLLQQGFDEWQFNWAWAGHSFRFVDGTIITQPQTAPEKAQNAALETNAWKEVDLVTLADMAPFCGLLGSSGSAL